MARPGFEPMNMNTSPYGGVHSPSMSRPQVGIERLPTRRMSNEPRESMNCKSCRKRKIKCNRLRPACEACQVFQCPCIYDAVPKKRGPKTDVLEALLKRVDGLEAKLKEQKQPDDEDASPEGSAAQAHSNEAVVDNEPSPKRPALLDGTGARSAEAPAPSSLYTSPPVSASSPTVQEDALLDLYFHRFHGKPYCILDESSVRQRLQLNQIPHYLLNSIYALSARYCDHPSGHQSAFKLSKDYAIRSRTEIDVDEPSIDAMQALLLLVLAFTSTGNGRKAFMLLTSAVGMAMALELHREVDPQASLTPVEREMRRRLFWTCYLLDRFMACGSKRPCLIGDKTIMLRLPCWNAQTEGDFFQSSSSFNPPQGGGRKSRGSSMGILIDIARILGDTNRYLAAGGVKGDSHFPWHSLSNLSKIRHELDIWASGVEAMFSSLDGLFGQPDSPTLVLSKLLYHLIHCLIYRPFLPIDLSELSGTGQHQSWQIEATSMCFLHANAIGELVELGKSTPIEWPGFVGYCVATAGTVHVHGAHYNQTGTHGQMGVFSASSEFLSREIQQLHEVRYSWASVQHQRTTLKRICTAHAELVKSLADHPMRYSPVFHLEDFFDRYSNIGGLGGQTFTFDHAYLSLTDVIVDFSPDSEPSPNGIPTYNPERSSNLKRKSMSDAAGRPKELSHLNTQQHQGLSTPNSHHQSYPLQSHVLQSPSHATSQLIDPAERSTAHHAASSIPALQGSSFSPSFNYGTPAAHQPDLHHHLGAQHYDPMFGGLPTNAFSSPAAWPSAEEDHQHHQRNPVVTGMPPAGVIGGGSGHPDTPGHNSTGEEKDPFLSLLEQLAENEQGQGNELDAFLAGVQA